MKLATHVPSDLAKRAAEMPAQYFTMATDSEPHGRDSALILTKDDVISIKRYEKAALSLPSTLKDVENNLGFSSSGVKGLEPADILKVYQGLRNHSLTWDPLEQDIKVTGVRLELFASNFIVVGNKLIEVVNAMDFMKQIEGTVGDLVLEDLKHLEGLPLGGHDITLKGGLRLLLDQLKKAINTELKRTEEVKQATTNFARTITSSLIPSVGNKLDLARRHGLAEKIQELNADILELDKVIEQKKKEYEQFVAQALDGGKFMGPIGLIVIGGIFGAKAEKVRKEKNALIKEREGKVAQVKVLVPLIHAMTNLENRFKDLEIRLLDAEEGANNLRDLWLMLFTYIDESHRKLEGIDDSLSVLVFGVEFAQVVKPWHDIKGISGQLSVLFNTALAEWRNIHDKEGI